MDITPRNSFNSRLADRYWQIPTDIPMATPYNVPIGTHLCDTLGYICHPQRYETFHKRGIFKGKYPDTNVESQLYNLDYYNLYDTICNDENTYKKMQPELIKEKYNGIPKCDLMNPPRLFNNVSKLNKYNQY
jgi:hypothetical protein